MEKLESLKRKRVLSELSEGMELSNKLKEELLKETRDSRDEALCGFLVEKIVSCYDNALSLLNCMESVENEDSVTLIPTSHDLDLFKDQLCEVVSKKRWSEQVRDEIQVDDGFNWRKYGQKDILGATHPRSYYRCTHRYTQGCLATKQRQRGEDDPCIFKVAYRGKHSCVVMKQNDEDMMINIESDPNVVEPQQLINSETQFSSEPTTDLYFSMPSHYNNRIDHYLPEMMISNSNSTMNFTSEDSDYLIDQIDFDSGYTEEADYFSLVQGSPESKTM
ncbi:hypothetical protein ACS0TY_002370 [Phlomoides rotata]